MELAQCRIVTDDVEGLAGFYARLLDVPAALNEYYVEIQAGPASVGFSRRRFTEHREADGRPAPSASASSPSASSASASSASASGASASSPSASSASASSASASSPSASSPSAPGPEGRGGIILDFLVDDVDAEHERIAALGVDWVMSPTTQLWGNRSMMFRDPAGNLVNVFSRQKVLS
jgi:uncharacterized glyoxalase superfamily protein PhnB